MSKDEDLVSDCHDAPVKANNPNAGPGEANFYICTKCEKPCTPKEKCKC